MQINTIKSVLSTLQVDSMNKKTYRIAILISARSKDYASPEDKRMSDHFLQDDILLEAAFKKHNLIYEEVIWDTPSIKWTDYDAVLIRSTWDYHEGKLHQFLNTLKSIENAGIPLFNSYKTIEWNCKKTYLKELMEIGIPIIDTLFATPGEMPNIEGLLVDRAWTKCILKPAVSAGANKTFKALTAPEAQSIYSKNYDADEIVLIQPFAEEIITDGEWSFVFLNGQYSHTVLKKPPIGDFRVQLFFGNQNKPEEWMIEAADGILKKVKAIINENPLYVRIDTIRRDGVLHLMEVELIEPYLYLQTSSDASDRLALSLKGKIATYQRLLTV